MEIRRNRAENKALKGSSVLKKNRAADMTTGSLLKIIILFSVPLVFTGPLQLVYNTADTVIVGRFAGKPGACNSCVADFDLFNSLGFGD